VPSGQLDARAGGAAGTGHPLPAYQEVAPGRYREDEGIVTAHTVGSNRDGVRVIKLDRTVVALMRSQEA
jgi:hypothetical protein